ncbi:MAG: YjzC family protein [Armatimonadota bacterium]
MCATCGCLTTGQPAPEEGTYKCVECEEAGKAEKATVRKGDSMPSCKTCGETKVHWVKT